MADMLFSYIAVVGQLVTAGLGAAGTLDAVAALSVAMPSPSLFTVAGSAGQHAAATGSPFPLARAPPAPSSPPWTPYRRSVSSPPWAPPQSGFPVPSLRNSSCSSTPGIPRLPPHFCHSSVDRHRRILDGSSICILCTRRGHRQHPGDRRRLPGARTSRVSRLGPRTCHGRRLDRLDGHCAAPPPRPSTGCP
jgi:hypothetical protein